AGDDRDRVTRAGLNDAGELPIAEDVLHEALLAVQGGKGQDEASAEDVRAVVAAARTVEVRLRAVGVGVVVAQTGAVGVGDGGVAADLALDGHVPLPVVGVGGDLLQRVAGGSESGGRVAGDDLVGVE